jgi:anthranilate synthase component 2/putative glutamine amidotransferase
MLPDGRITHWRHGGAAVPRSYIDSLTRAGATGALVTRGPTPEIGRFDGLVLTGGGDVDPTVYGEEPREKLYSVDPARDQLELELARAALGRGTPILAICRGMQVLNIALGGTLDQHIGDREGILDHGQGGPTPVLREVRLDPDSYVAKAIGTDQATCSCHHHQAAARLGDGVRVVGRTEDGVIEAIELEGAAHVLAVQWHPEDTADADPVQQQLFDSFVALMA